MSISPEWLSLIEYRNKYKVSVSTLRRRIREKDIKFQLVRGKYFVFDEPIKVKAEPEKYIKTKIKENFVDEAPIKVEPAPVRKNAVETDAKILLDEIKSAYQKILKEKEEQIFLLKEEIVNQQTLIRVLEEENKRFRIFK